MSAVLMSANRGGSAAGGAPEREAKTEEMSPSFRARSRGCPATVARERVKVGRRWTPRGGVSLRMECNIVKYMESNKHLSIQRIMIKRDLRILIPVSEVGVLLDVVACEEFNFEM
jgi:hypothetical protein